MNNSPVGLYKDLKNKIPQLKENLCDFLNAYHGVKKSKEFWWFLGGEYALYAEYFSMLSKADPRLFYELQRTEKSSLRLKDISTIVVNLIGRDSILTVNQGLLRALENLLGHDKFFFTDEERHFVDISEGDNREVLILFKKVTKVLYFIDRAKRRCKLNFKKPFSGRVHERRSSLGDGFDTYLAEVLPSDLMERFPSWFLFISGLMVREGHKWITRLGHELNIFQSILMASSYDKFGEKNIDIVSHGSVTGSVGIWHLFRFSLFPDLVFGVNNKSLVLKSKEKSTESFGVLYCPPQFPWTADFMSISQWRKLLSVHQATIDILRKGLRSEKKIRIRYKDFLYLRSYSGQLCPEEIFIPVEEREFEDIYCDYSLIVTIPFGTIAAKCHANNIDYLAYHQAVGPVDQKTYNYIAGLSGVFCDEDSYLSELNKRIESLLVR